MDSRKLNRVITIQRPSSAQDTVGQPASTWQVFRKVWADVLHENGAELIRADAETSIVKASFRIRYLRGVHASMRVLLDSTVYEIKAVLPDEQFRDKVHLVCEVVNA